MYSELSRTIDDAPSEYAAPDPDRFVLACSGAIIAGLVEGVMQGEAFLALVGPPGSGKTTVAAALSEELASRSVRVASVARGKRGSLRLADIASQLLGKPEAALNDADIEKLFDVMTVQESSATRFVVMIDDAEILQTAALEYLRLLSSMATEVAPQFIFVGRPQFRGLADYPVPSKFQELVTARWELDRVSPDTTRQFIGHLVGSMGLSVANLFDGGGFDALVQASDGLFGRAVSLLSLARDMQVDRQEHRLTANLVIQAAAQLDGEVTVPVDNASPSTWTKPGITALVEPAFLTPALSVPVALPAAEPLPERFAMAEPSTVAESLGMAAVPTVDAATSVLDLDAAWLVGPGMRHRLAGWHRYAYAGCLVVLLSAAGAVSYWRTSAGAHGTDTPAGGLVEPAAAVAAEGSAASGAVVVSRNDKPAGLSDIKVAVENEAPLSQAVEGAAATPPSPASTETGAPGADRPSAPPLVAARAETSPTEQPTQRGVTQTSAVAGDAVPNGRSPLPAVAQSAAQLTKAPPQPEVVASQSPVQAGSAQATGAAGPLAEAAGPAVDAAAPAIATAIATAPTVATAPAAAPTVATEPAAAPAAVPTDGAAPAVSPTAVAAAPAAASPVGAAPAVPASATSLVAAAPAVPAATVVPDAAATVAPGPVAMRPAAAPLVATLIAPPGAAAPAGSAAATMPAASPGPIASAPTPPAAAIAAAPIAEVSAAAASPAAPTTAIAAPATVASAPVGAASPEAADNHVVTPDSPTTTAQPLPRGGIVVADLPREQRVPVNPGPPAFAARELPVLLSRGDAMLALGDIVAGRLLFERAASLGSARAATEAGKTYDPVFLNSIQANGVTPDRGAALAWYRKGAALGDPEGRRLAGMVEAQSSN